MAPGGGDGERPLGHLLVPHLAVVGDEDLLREGFGVKWARLRKGGDAQPQVRERGHGAASRACHGHGACRDERRAEVVGELGIGDHPPCRQDLARQGELAHEDAAVDPLAGELARGAEDGHGDREVEGGARLAQVRRRQADHDAESWHDEPGGPHGRPHARPRLEDRLVRHADYRHPWNPVRGRDLHLDLDGLDAAKHSGTQAEDLPRPRWPRSSHSVHWKAPMRWRSRAVLSATMLRAMTSKRRDSTNGCVAR